MRWSGASEESAHGVELSGRGRLRARFFVWTLHGTRRDGAARSFTLLQARISVRTQRSCCRISVSPRGSQLYSGPLTGYALAVILMTKPSLDKLRSEALGLTESERADLAHDLLSSLDGPADRDAATAWDHEIARRVAEIDSHTASLIDRQELSRRMRDRLRR